MCSDDPDPRHAITPLDAGDDPQATWQALLTCIEGDPAYTIIERSDHYLKAEARTRWLRFVDDVEFELRAAHRQIAMRSASRVGYSDLGANRRRLESLRRTLQGRT